MCVCLRAGARTRLCVCLRAYERACVCVCVCAFAWVRAYVRACERVCKRSAASQVSKCRRNSSTTSTGTSNVSRLLEKPTFFVNKIISCFIQGVGCRR